MKVKSEIKNCDKFFMRRMCGWIAKTLGVPCKKIQMANFDYCKSIWNANHKGQGVIVVRIGEDNKYPLQYKSVPKPKFFADDIELLIYLSAFLIQGKSPKCDRGSCNFAANHCLVNFRENRAKLVFDWCKPEKIKEKKEVSLLSQRRNKVRLALEMWERKFKLAKTKVAKYKKKLAYYDKKISD